MTKYESLRLEKLSLLIGTMIGQIAELCNQIKSKDIDKDRVYRSLFDINDMAAIQVHELYYKGNKRERGGA